MCTEPSGADSDLHILIAGGDVDLASVGGSGGGETGARRCRPAGTEVVVPLLTLNTSTAGNVRATMMISVPLATSRA